MQLSARLDYCARDLGRLWGALELADMELIDALGGRRREELRTAYARFGPDELSCDDGIDLVCRHRDAYPACLRGIPLAPRTLWLRGGGERLKTVLHEPVVAIVGTSRASDYGRECARGLARALAGAEVTVACALSEGIGVAAHLGVLEAGGKALTVMASGVDRCSPAGCASLYRRAMETGCAISEVPAGMRARAWCEPARARTLALLAQLVVVVEAEERPWALACADVAQRLEIPLAAVPGRVSAPTSRGSNLLLRDGARLVRDADDVLESLLGARARRLSDRCDSLEPRMRSVFEQVGAGRDTVAKLTAAGMRFGEVALALAELELDGLIVRGDGGRYMPRGGLGGG